MTTLSYIPVWSDGKPRPKVTVKVAEMETDKDGYVRGKDTNGVTFGPIPPTWIVQ